MSNRACHRSRGRIQLRMNGLQIKLSTNFTFTAENPYNSPLYSMPTDELNLVRQSQFSKTRRKQRTTPTKLHFSSVGKHAVKWLPAADRKHVNTSCGDTVKCLLDAGKSPIFRLQSLYGYIRTKVTVGHHFRTDISVQNSERVNFTIVFHSLSHDQYG